ncbi:hypothetical protein [Rhodococcus sp. NCIMB 12038]|uniref:hypothetical protein n=1 Tax=Rhodococcus sp. NCIMB 12038 TaxID=933800 RepID=UPI000B3D4673|nr:hypothetical protein [Rhodococcus sp. NCIMB 12038]OUS95069.1 hypothetical protein CA951_13410 [Rhodococcus sp. NCIMB 12038]
MTELDRAGETTPAEKHERDAMIRKALEGEIVGCAMYREMIVHTQGVNKAPLELLFELERVTAAALEPVAARYGVAVDRDAATAEGLQLASELLEQPWETMWSNITGLAEDYLGYFQRLATALEGTDSAAAGRQAVEHEEALIEFARREVGKASDPHGPLLDYLSRYAG